jgi:hypothetical protein
MAYVKVQVVAGLVTLEELDLVLDRRLEPLPTI